MKLLQKGRFLKYLTYAFGEILLIFLGINLAIWFNTQREEEVGRSNERSILEGMVSDLDGEMAFFSHMINALNDEIAQDSLLLSPGLQTASLSEIREGLKFLNAPFNWVRDESYQELLSLEKKGVIKNAELRERIDEYYDSAIPNLFNWTNYDFDLVLSSEKLIELNDEVKLFSDDLPASLDTAAYKADLVQFAESAQVHNIIQFDLNRKVKVTGSLVGALEEAEKLKALIEQEL